MTVVVATQDQQAMNAEERFSLNELCEIADVTPRTIRYYISEGLIPPPVVAGARSYYTEEHRDRLELIAALKSDYLPLREIRRRISGMTLDEVRQELATSVQPGIPLRAAESDQMDEQTRTLGFREEPASEYLQRVLQTQRSNRTGGVAGSPAPGSPVRQLPVASGRIARQDESPSAGGSNDTWRRLPIGEDAELMVREESYQKNREKFEWLIDWARKVLE